MKRFGVAVAVVALMSGAAGPAMAANNPGRIGTVSFSGSSIALSNSAKSALTAMSADLKSTSAVRLEAYGGMSSAVSKSKANSRAAARAAAVQAWLKSKGVGGSVTVVNKGWASSAGSDQGNRVELVATAKKVTFKVTSTSGPSLDSAAVTVCDVTPTSASVTVGSSVKMAVITKAAAKCEWSLMLPAVAVGATSTVNVTLTCPTENTDGTPGTDALLEVQVAAPWSVPDVASRSADSGSMVATLAGVKATAKTASLGTLVVSIPRVG